MVFSAISICSAIQRTTKLARFFLPKSHLHECLKALGRLLEVLYAEIIYKVVTKFCPRQATEYTHTQTLAEV
eukprot:3053538-Amphidinium_carterae.1